METKWDLEDNLIFAANTTEIQRHKYNGQWHDNKLDNLEEINSFLKTHNSPRLSQEEAEYWNEHNK